MTMRSGSRLRQTAHYGNDLVDRRNILFRSDFLIIKLIIIFSMRVPLKVVIAWKDKNEVEGHRKVNLRQNTDFLEYVEFDEIVVSTDLFCRKEVRREEKYRRYLEEQLLNEQVLGFVRSHRLKCFQLRTHEVSFRAICQIARTVQFRKFKDDTFVHDLVPSTDFFLSQTCRKISIYADLPGNNFLSQIRNFEHVTLRNVNKSFTSEFAAFIEDCRFSDTGRLRKVFIQVGPFLGVSTRKTWPGTFNVFHENVHYLQPIFGQIHLILPVHSDKLIIILTKEQNFHTDQLVYFVEPEDIQGVVLLIIELCCPLRAVDGSQLFEEISTRPQEDLPDILQSHLHQIYH